MKPTGSQETTPASLDRWRTVGIVIVLLGCALRLAYAFPVHKYAADADCLNIGLRAFRILEGAHPVFLTPVRAGCLECYEQAVAFAVFGVGRTSLALAPLLASVLVLLIYFYLLRSLFDGPTASLALLFLALPPPAYAYWTYMPNGYPETILLCAAAICLTYVIADKGLGGGRGFALGLLAGLGGWNSPLTLAALIPALIWLAWFRRDLLRQGRQLVLAFGGFLVGAAAWILYNLRHNFASLHEDLVTGAASGPLAVASNLGYFLLHQIPELALSKGPAANFTPHWLQWVLRIPVLVTYYAALFFGTVVFIAWLVRAFKRQGGRLPPRWALLLLVLPTNLGLYLFSKAGMGRGWTVRAILPSYLSLFVLLALFILWVGRHSRPAAWILSSVIIISNLSGYSLWWSPERIRWREGLEDDRRLMTFLQGRGIQAICGNYWLVYPVNFLSREKVLGIPDAPSVDFYKYYQRLGNRPLQWALLSNSDLQLRAWATEAAVDGAIDHPSPKYFVFVPNAAASHEDPMLFLEKLVAARHRILLRNPG